MAGRKLEPMIPTQPPRLSARLESQCMEPGMDHDNKQHTDALFDGITVPDLTARHWDIRRSVFRNSNLQASRISKLEFTDVRLDQCQLANASWQEAAVFRSEFRSCRMTGINFSNSVIRHTLFEGCEMKLSTL